MRRTRSKTLLILLAATFCAFIFSGVLEIAYSSPAQSPTKKYPLEYKLAEGTKLALATHRKHRIERPYEGERLITETQGRYRLDVEIEKSNEAGLALALEYKQMSHQTDSPFIKTVPDFSGLIGKKASFALSSKGELSGFKGFDGLPVVRITGQESVGPEHYINELKDIIPRLPDSPVDFGDSWSYVNRYTSPVENGHFDVTLKHEFSLLDKELKDGHDCLLFGGKYTVVVEGEIHEAGQDYDLKFEGEGHETVWFAWKRGMFVQIESRSVSEGAAINRKKNIHVPMKHEFKTTTKAEFD